MKSASEVRGELFHLVDGRAILGQVSADETAGECSDDQRRLDRRVDVLQPLTPGLLPVLFVQPFACFSVDAEGVGQLGIQQDMDLARVLEAVDPVAALGQILIATAAGKV